MNFCRNTYFFASMLNRETVKMNDFIWLLKYLGIPLGIVVSVYRLFLSSKNSKLPANLSGKVVFISGASSGVGEALAHTFYSCGCKVVLAARRLNELERVKKDLMGKKTNSLTYEPVVVGLDLSEINTLEQVVQDTYKLCGHVDILINNGGISSRGSILDTNLHVHSRLMNVNYFGPVGLTKAMLPKMIEHQAGHIVFVSSVQGRIAIPERAAYSASKHACQAFADVLRAEVDKHNINVSVISPGYIQTALSLNALTGSGGQHGVMDNTTASGYKAEYVAERILNMVVNKQNELTLAPISPKVAILLRTLTPTVYFWIMAKRAKKTE